MKFKDYYQTLGIGRDACADEIKRAYRALARRYHPDLSKEPDAGIRFNAIGEAYEVLKDTKKRAAYDNLGAGWSDGQEFTPPAQWSAFFRDGGRTGPVDFGEFSDFFESLIDNDVPGRDNPDRADMPGADLQYAVEVSIEEACRGGERLLRLQTVTAQSADITNREQKVKIPPGVTEGQRIRLAGQGDPGPGGRRGDLFLRIALRTHPLFRLVGRDVHLRLPVTPWEAALGATIKVPTASGTVDLKVPPGSNTGRKLRLRGRGLGRNPVGDQYVELAIHTPAVRNADDEALYRRFARQMKFDPREVMMSMLAR